MCYRLFTLHKTSCQDIDYTTWATLPYLIRVSMSTANPYSVVIRRDPALLASKVSMNNVGIVFIGVKGVYKYHANNLKITHQSTEVASQELNPAN